MANAMNFNSKLGDRSGFSIVRNRDSLDASAILAHVEALSNQLKKAGVQAGDKIVFKEPNGAGHFIVFLVCEKMELLYVPVFNEVTQEELNFILEDLGFCRHIFCDENELDFKIQEYNPGKQHHHEQSVISGCIFKTSGTTSKQKYIFHNFNNMWENAGIAMAGQDINPASKVLSLLTYSHMGGFCMQALPALRAGATIIIEEKRNFAAVAEKLKHSSHSVIVPSVFRYLYEYCEKKSITFTNSPVIITGSVPVNNSVLKKMLNLNFRVQVIYGLTEMGPYVSCFKVNSLSDLKKNEFCLGEPLPGYSIALDDKDGQILLNGPCKGQIFDPATNRCEPLPHCGPWLETGDAGITDAGNIYFTGRLTLTINVGGFKVNPQEIENVILGVPGVESCIVIGEKHFSLGEVPIAYIKGQGANSDLITQRIHESLARYKWPRKILFVEHLPETSIGKTKRKI